MPTGPADTYDMRLRSLSIALEGTGAAVLHQDADHVFDLAQNLPWPWSAVSFLGRREGDALPADLAPRFSLAFDACRNEQTRQRLEFAIYQDREQRHFEAVLLPDADGVVTVVRDITQERTREATLQSLLREVSHRSKNLLAIVQSVAMQTAHHSGDIQDFLAKFRGRLHALSSTQDLVTESDWRGTYLHSLVAAQATRVGHAALATMRITGDNPLLGPNASLHIGLAIHELAANAVRHGALARGGAGSVWVDAHVEAADNGAPQLVIEWQEAGGDPKRIRQPPHFGTLVLERIVPLSVGGAAQFSIDADSVRYRLVVPADQFES